VLCALGLNQLSKINKFKSRRKEIYNMYQEGLKDLPELELPIERGYVDSNWHLFPVRANPNQRREVFEKLRAKGIGVQVNYIPAYRHPVFDKYQIDRNKFLVSEDFYSREISLPFYTDLSNSNIDFIIDSIKSLYLEI